MTRNPEGHRHLDLDLRDGDEDDEFLSDESYAAGIDTFADDLADDGDDYDSVDVIADELNLMGIHCASDFS